MRRCDSGSRKLIHGSGSEVSDSYSVAHRSRSASRSICWSRRRRCLTLRSPWITSPVTDVVNDISILIRTITTSISYCPFGTIVIGGVCKSPIGTKSLTLILSCAGGSMAIMLYTIDVHRCGGGSRWNLCGSIRTGGWRTGGGGCTCGST